MKINVTGKKIGIWGFGEVGKSSLSFFSQFPCSLSVCDSRELNGHEQALLEGHNARFVPYSLLPQFLEAHDFIVPSPGISLHAYQEIDEIKEKFLHPLDIFAQNLTKPTIAVTGSVGKTTTVAVLAHLLNKLGKKALIAGNSGVPLFDALSIQDRYDIIVLELSSFQLQYQTQYQADIAVITNFIPNHLDQHKTLEEYLTAKGQLFARQAENQKAIIPFSLMDTVWNFTNGQKITWVGPDAYQDITKKLSDITCHENMQLILEVLETMELSTENVEQLCADFKPLEHRVEFVKTVNGISFYNDSKATLADSTLQAVNRFDKPILFLGGLSKGVDRAPLVKALRNKVKSVICFGKEADDLNGFCKKYKIESTSHKTLEQAFDYCITIAQSGDTVLFSPSGSSYDLFKNYIERGNRFKELIKDLK